MIEKLADIVVNESEKQISLNNEAGEAVVYPHTGILFPDLNNDDEYYTSVTAVNMLVIYHEAKYMLERAYDKEWDIREMLPPIGRNVGDEVVVALLNRVEKFIEDIENGKAPIAECVADELILHYLLDQAKNTFEELEYIPTLDRVVNLVDQNVEDGEFENLREEIFQDYDALMLYDMRFDGIEEDESFGATNLNVKDWFKKF